jgi:hypothetical protein
MRENGVPKFPDPSESGGITMDQGSGIDPNSDEFKAAQAKCEQFVGEGPDGAVGPGDQAGGKQG